MRIKKIICEFKCTFKRLPKYIICCQIFYASRKLFLLKLFFIENALSMHFLNVLVSCECNAILQSVLFLTSEHKLVSEMFQAKTVSMWTWHISWTCISGVMILWSKVNLTTGLPYLSNQWILYLGKWFSYDLIRRESGGGQEKHSRTSHK